MKDREVWSRVFEMTRDDNLAVRRNDLHGIIDGLPAELTDEASAVLEQMRNDPDPKLRRNVRKILARRHRTGRINEG
jgi:hypothetical protein